MRKRDFREEKMEERQAKLGASVDEGDCSYVEMQYEQKSLPSIN